MDATVQMTNTGDRTGKQVMQIYASRPESAIDRPVRWLVGFAVARQPRRDHNRYRPDPARALPTGLRTKVGGITKRAHSLCRPGPASPTSL